MTSSAEPQMRGFTPVTEWTWDSRALKRRIMLNKIDGMPLSDVKALLLETEEVIASIKDQLSIHQDSDADWVRRAMGKRRLAKLFASSCRHRVDGHKALAREEMRLESERLKTERTQRAKDRNIRKAAKTGRVVYNLLVEEWGKDRTDAFYSRVGAVVDALMEQEEAEAA